MADFGSWPDEDKQELAELVADELGTQGMSRREILTSMGVVGLGSALGGAGASNAIGTASAGAGEKGSITGPVDIDVDDLDLGDFSADALAGGNLKLTHDPSGTVWTFKTDGTLASPALETDSATIATDWTVSKNANGNYVIEHPTSGNTFVAKSDGTFDSASLHSNGATIDGTATVNGTASLQDIGVQGAAEGLDKAFPGWGTAVSVPASGSDREVTTSFNIAADTDSPARITSQREDSSGTFQRVSVIEIPAGIITTAITVPMSFTVPRGRSYKFVRSGNAGVTETNESYGFTEHGI